jgi:hypothetical protein
MTVSLADPAPFHRQGCTISPSEFPLAFTARPLGRVFIASSEVVSFYRNCKNRLLERTLVVLGCQGGWIKEQYVNVKSAIKSQRIGCRGSSEKGPSALWLKRFPRTAIERID